MSVIYQNQWCRIIAKETYYVLQSKSGKYNDQYFLTLDAAYKYIGHIPESEKYSFQ